VREREREREDVRLVQQQADAAALDAPKAAQKELEAEPAKYSIYLTITIVQILTQPIDSAAALDSFFLVELDKSADTDAAGGLCSSA
jgi:hypothetical protein